MSCAEIRELFSARVDDALSVEERAQLDAHLATCADCVQEWQRFERAVSLLRATEPARAPAGFVDRVLAARPRPWYRRLARFVLVPWTVKLPLEAAAILLVAGLAVVIFQRSPELQREAYAPPPVSAPSRTNEATASPPTVKDPASETPGSTGTLLGDARQRAQESVPRAVVSPEERKESTAARDTLGSADSPRKAKIAESGPSGATAPEGAVKREPPARAETALKSAVDTKKDDAAERGGAARQPAPAPAASAPPAPTAPAPVPAPAAPPPAASALVTPPDAGARAMQKSAEVQRLAAAPPGGVQARLPVTDPVAAERTVRDLVARANGQVASRVEDGAAIILALAIPTDRWEEVKRSLENLGALRLEPRGDESARLVRITLRLER